MENSTEGDSDKQVSNVWIVKEIGRRGNPGLLDRLGELADNNLRLFRTIPWVVGGIGIILLYRKTHLFKQFQKVTKISDHLIAANTRLYGRAASCDWDSVYVWHVSLAMRCVGWRTKPSDTCPDRLLRVKFAGVAVTSPQETKQWLESEVLHCPVWFTPLAVNRDQQALECVVHSRRKVRFWSSTVKQCMHNTGKMKGIFQRRYSVNRALLSTGLGVVAECSGFKDPKAQDKFHRMLMKSEREAQSRGRGVWEGSEHVVWWRRLTRTVQNIFKSR